MVLGYCLVGHCGVVIIDLSDLSGFKQAVQGLLLYSLQVSWIVVVRIEKEKEKQHRPRRKNKT